MRPLSNSFFATVFFTLVFLTSSLKLDAQAFQEINYPMIVDGKELAYGFLGGISNPIFSNADLNDDGIQDVIIFDKNGNRIYTFLHTGQSGTASFVHAPQYEASFPDIKNWAVFKDYNKDGVVDIFCATPYNNNGVAVYKGVKSNGTLSFERVLFPNNTLDMLYYTQIVNGNPIRLDMYVAVNTDVPAIEDIDGDGDLDILSFESGGSFLVFYRNMAVERGLGNDGLDYELGDGCWGKVKEGGLDATIFLSANTNNCAQGLVGGELVTSTRHSGSTVCVFDGDGDGDMDVVLGDIGSDRLVYLKNGGTNNDAYITESILDYPPGQSAVQHIFPAMYYVDVSGDGLNDLVVAPTSKESSININHTWYYENIGTAEDPQFELKAKNLLMTETINIGKYSHPLFLDYNADGLMDIMVGSAGYRVASNQVDLGIHLFQNVGTAEAPAFELVDKDYLGFSQLEAFSIRLAPTLGDVDNDGDQDIIIGDNHGKLYFFENKGGEGQPMQFDGYVYEFSNIDVGSNAKPTLIDINMDGWLDLVVGESNKNQDPQSGIFGHLNYFIHSGDVTNPYSEDPSSDIFGQFNQPGDSNIVPKFIRKEDGSLQLFIGTDRGAMRMYNADSDAFELLQDSLGEIHIGRNIAFDMADINGDGQLELVVGNRRGGLDLFETPFLIDGTDTPTKEINKLAHVSIYPNPSANVVSIKSDRAVAAVEIYNLNGQLLSREINTAHVNIANHPAGMYLMHVLTDNGQRSILKLIKE